MVLRKRNLVQGDGERQRRRRGRQRQRSAAGQSSLVRRCPDSAFCRRAGRQEHVWAAAMAAMAAIAAIAARVSGLVLLGCLGIGWLRSRYLEAWHRTDLARAWFWVNNDKTRHDKTRQDRTGQDRTRGGHALSNQRQPCCPSATSQPSAFSHASIHPAISISTSIISPPPSTAIGGWYAGRLQAPNMLQT
jgi:hypothetical protein